MPCFNVTSDDFNAPTPSSSASPSAGAGLSGAPTSDQSTSSGGLSGGAKAGIAVGAVIGGLALFGVIGFFLWRRGKNAGLKGKNEYELRAKDLSSPGGTQNPGA